MMSCKILDKNIAHAEFLHIESCFLSLCLRVSVVN
jgi:hypothetical protein